MLNIQNKYQLIRADVNPSSLGWFVQIEFAFHVNELGFNTGCMRLCSVPGQAISCVHELLIDDQYKYINNLGFIGLTCIVYRHYAHNTGPKHLSMQ